MENKDLEYYKKNAEENYITTPISVLRYISELEEVVKNCSMPVVKRQVCRCGIKRPFVGYDGKTYCKFCNEEIVTQTSK